MTPKHIIIDGEEFVAWSRPLIGNTLKAVFKSMQSLLDHYLPHESIPEMEELEKQLVEAGLLENPEKL